MNRVLLLGCLLVALVSCGEVEKPAPPQPPPAPPVVEVQIDERQVAMDLLEGRLGEVRDRLGKGQEAAGTRTLEIQAAWSVSLRELRRQLGEIAERLARLRKRKDQPWEKEVDEIQAAAEGLERQFQAELEALSRYR